MDATRPMTRRDVARGIAASAAASVLPCPALAQGAAHIVVIGGGFGGASCARALRRLDPKLQVSLIEPNQTFTACPFSNEVIAGMRELAGAAIQLWQDRRRRRDRHSASRREGRSAGAHRHVWPTAHSLSYDRLVLSPGIDLRFDALPGYDEAASLKMPHAWKAGEQTMLLRRQIEAMEDGGTVVIAVPAAPLRCPPAPYERASLIAHYLKTRKPRSKVLILDAKDGFSQQRLFEAAWKELYPGMIERIALSQGGRVTSVDPATSTIVTDFGNYTADVASVIPPQKAGRIAELSPAPPTIPAGARSIRSSFASKLVPNIHVIGDACIAGQIPKAASAASAQGKACAAAIVAMISGKAPETPRLSGACYNTVAPGYAFSLSGVYQPKDGQFAEVEGATSPVNAPREVRQREAEAAENWFRTITVETFG